MRSGAEPAGQGSGRGAQTCGGRGDGWEPLTPCKDTPKAVGSHPGLPLFPFTLFPKDLKHGTRGGAGPGGQKGQKGGQQETSREPRTSCKRAASPSQRAEAGRMLGTRCGFV